MLPGLWSLSPLGALVGVLVLLFWMLATGRLWTRAAHVEAVGREKESKDEWKEAHRVSEIARATLQAQNSALLAGVRIADKFYKDFLPPQPDEKTIPQIPGGHDAVV